MQNIEIEDNKYEIIKNYRDWAYDKLRLKGFYEDNNPKSKDINKISNLDKYLKENCAYDCKYFVAKKIII